MHTSYAAFCLSFFDFGPSWVGVSLGLDVLGDLDTYADTSMLSTFGAASSTAIATSKVVPSTTISSLALTVSAGVDIILENNSYVSFGNLSNTELAIKSSKFSQFMHA